jgi:hypothetical protein
MGLTFVLLKGFAAIRIFFVIIFTFPYFGTDGTLTHAVHVCINVTQKPM